MGASLATVARRQPLLVGLLLTLALTGCDRDLGSITAYGPGTAQMSFVLDEPTHITFVTNLEVEGATNLDQAAGVFEYTLEALQQDLVVAKTRCDALRIGESFSRSRRESANRIGSFRHSITKGVLEGCSLDVAQGGPTRLHVLLTRKGKPAVHLIHLELVARR